MLRVATGIEAVVVWIGRTIAWLTLAMVLVTVAVVIMRYFFASGRIWMQELVTWSHAAVFLLGAGYTLARDEHVRVDVLYRRFSPATQACINIAGTVLFLFPVCGFLARAAGHYAFKSWQVMERSPETGGLGYPLIPLAKTLLFAMFVLLIFQGIVGVLRSLHALRTGEFEPPAPREEVL